jgi:hypothetical protein
MERVLYLKLQKMLLPENWREIASVRPNSNSCHIAVSLGFFQLSMLLLSESVAKFEDCSTDCKQHSRCVQIVEQSSRVIQILQTKF